MFDLISNFFTYVIDFFVSAIESIVTVSKLLFTLTKDLPLFIKLTTAFSADIPHYINWLPESIVSLVVITVGLVLAYKFFGRT